MSSRTFHKARVAVAVTAVAAGGLAATALPASAGSNGQHVQICTSFQLYTKADVWGTDHNGNFAETGVTQLDYDGCTQWGGIWFKGNITIRLYRRDGKAYEEFHKNVPTSQSSDWVYYYVQ